jgi:Glycosyltransferase family 20
VVLIIRHVPLYERIAFYTIADVCVVTAVRDGMNLIPYEYVICREGTANHASHHTTHNNAHDANDAHSDENNPNSQNVDFHFSLNPTLTPISNQKKAEKCSMLIVSEFIGCSPSLSGAIRVNPWNIESVADALNSAITMSKSEQHLRHEKHYQFVSNHSVGYWAQSFIGDLERSCRFDFITTHTSPHFFHLLYSSPSFSSLLHTSTPVTSTHTITSPRNRTCASSTMHSHALFIAIRLVLFSILFLFFPFLSFLFLFVFPFSVACTHLCPV